MPLCLAQAALKESSSVLKIAKELAQAIPSQVSVVGEKGRRGEEKKSEETLVVREESPVSKQPPQPKKREVREKDKELMQKVKELQKRKAELQKQRHSSKVKKKFFQSCHVTFIHKLTLIF